MRFIAIVLFALLLPITANATTCTGATYLYSSNVPDGYTELEYIESTGTQWIDTGYVLQSSHVKMYLQYMKTSDSLSGSLIGASSTTRDYDWFTLYYNDYGAYDAYWAIGSGNVFYHQTTKDVLHNMEIEVFPDYTYNIVFDSQTDSGSWGGSFTGPDAGSVYLFTMSYYPSGWRLRNGSARLYSALIYDDGILVRNLVPARRDSDGVLGMYDTVSETFFTNSGTGTFVAGADVGTCLACPNGYNFNTANGKTSINQCQIRCNAGTYVPNEYTVLEYIESSGTQYINLGRRIGTDENITLKFAFLNDKPQEFFGAADGTDWRMPKFTFSYPDANPLMFMIYSTANNNLIPYWYYSAYACVIGMVYTLNWYGNPYKTATISPDLGWVNSDHEPYTPTRNAYLFWVNYPDIGTSLSGGRSMRVYSFRVDGKMDLVPVRRNSDGAIGMYDTIGGAFLANAGTGSFIAGSDVGAFGSSCAAVEPGYYSNTNTVNFGSTGTRIACTNTKPANSHYSGSGGEANNCPFECDSGYGLYNGVCHARCPYGDGELHVGQYTHPLWADITNVPSPSVYIGELGPNHDGLCYAYLEPDDTPVDNHHGFHTVHNGVPYHAINLGLYGLE